MVFIKEFTREKIREAIFMYYELRSFRKVEKLLHIGKSTVQRWHNRFRVKIVANDHQGTGKRNRKCISKADLMRTLLHI